MNAKSIIRKKRDGFELSEEEIRFVALEGAKGEIPDYQLAAFFMAVFFRSMSPAETAHLARAMLDSGERLAFDATPGVPTDKHSTGGVGDKLSFLVAPLVAAAGVPVPMISGRSLGHTGGTLDKLEAIPGFRADLSASEMRRQIGEIGLFISGQTAELAPADRRFYALRDAASIVESIPLIVGSILSKKAAAGVRALVLDVKVGTGAFMTTRDQAGELARALVDVAGHLGMRARSHLTPMEHLLGRTAGNSIELAEAIEALRGDAVAPDLRALTLLLGGSMLELAGAVASVEAGQVEIERRWDSGEGLERLRRMISAQGGDPRVVERGYRFPEAPHAVDVLAPRAGYLIGVRARPIGEWITEAGGGRLVAGARLDHRTGVELLATPGAEVSAATPILRLHFASRAAQDQIEQRARSWIEIAEERPVSFAAEIERVS